MKILVNYHSSVSIDDQIFIDPLNMTAKNKAKYVFLTHPHWDHFSLEDMKKIVMDDTIIVCPILMQEEVSKNFSNRLLLVEPNKSYVIDGIKFETFPSYNLNKEFHPRQNNWVGYIIEVENKRIAVVGDTDNTPELRSIKTEILLVPIGGTYTMDFREAAEVTNIINPEKVIPTHYGEIVGNKNLGADFKKLVDNKIICELQL